MIGSRTRQSTGRGGVAVVAAGGVVAAALSVVTLTAAPALGADTITFRSAAEAAWNQTTARVSVPSATMEGDGMLLFVTTNKDVSFTTPTGWTREGSRLATTDTETTLFSKQAVDGDAGRNVALTLSETAKSTLTLLAYDGTAADPVAAFGSAAETVNRTAHTTPGATVATDRSVVVSYWADKSGQDTSGSPCRRPDRAEQRRGHRGRPDLLRGLRQRARLRGQHPRRHGH